MNNEQLWNDLHIGRMVKNLVDKKHITASKISEVFNRYTHNSDKIYKLDDMYVDDLVRISYLAEYNLLEEISEKYLSHIPIIKNKKTHKTITITMNMQTKRLTNHQNAGKCDFLKDIHVGHYLKALAQKNRWSNRSISDLLKCAQSLISYYYALQNMKIKKMIELSVALNHNFIAEIYLSRMHIVPMLDQFDECILTITEQNVRITNPNDDTFLWEYKRKYCCE